MRNHIGIGIYIRYPNSALPYGIADNHTDFGISHKVSLPNPLPYFVGPIALVPTLRDLPMPLSAYELRNNNPFTAISYIDLE